MEFTHLKITPDGDRLVLYSTPWWCYTIARIADKVDDIVNPYDHDWLYTTKLHRVTDKLWAIQCIDIDRGRIVMDIPISKEQSKQWWGSNSV